MQRPASPGQTDPPAADRPQPAPAPDVVTDAIRARRAAPKPNLIPRGRLSPRHSQPRMEAARVPAEGSTENRTGSHQLEVVDVRAHRGRREVLKGISFTVDAGECLGVAGPNGAGKSTMLGVLAGWLHLSSGQVLVGGQPLHGHGKVPPHIGYATQEVMLYPHLSGRENLRFFGSLYDLGGRELDSRVEMLEERFHLEDWAHRKAEAYSGGVARRFHLAIALLNNPAVVLLDEPTAGLDPASRLQLLKAIGELLDGGTAVVMTGQILSDLEVVSNKLMVLVDGEPLVYEGTSELIQQLGEGVVEIEIANHKARRIDLDQVDGVLSWRSDEGVIFARVANPAVALPGILEHLSSRGLVASRMEIQPPSLEELLRELVPSL